jgi:zinc transport system substrate-binding protein
VKARNRSGLHLALLLVLPSFAAVGALAVVLERGGSDRATAGPLLVTASVPPQAWLVRRIGGERVSVEVLLPPGSSVHTYEPTPRQMARATATRLLVEVGHPDLLFERRLVASLRSRPGLEVVTTSAGVPPLPAGAGEETDPHVWVSPAAMRATARAVAAALERLDPAGAGVYRAGLAGALADLDRAEAEARRLLADVPRRRVYVYHPAWGYLLRELGLEQVALESHGKEPGPRQLQALVENARRDGVRHVFVQRGFSDRPARALAEEIGAEVVTLDPLAEDWAANLPRVAARLREAVGG